MAEKKVEEKVYYPHNFARIDGRGVFIEISDISLGIGKMLLNFCKYNTQTNKMEYTIPCYFDITTFLFLNEIIKSGAVLSKAQLFKKEGKNEALYSKLSGVPSSKVESRKKDFPFEVPKGKAVAKIFEICHSTKSDYLLRASYFIGDDNNKTGIIVPEGNRLSYIMIPVKHEDLCGMFLYGTHRLTSFETTKMIINPNEYFKPKN